MGRRAALALALLASLASPPAAAQTADADAMRQALRSAERAEAARRAGVPSVDALPRYDLTIDLADDLRTFELDETVRVTNRSSRPWGTVVLRVWANTVVPAGEPPRVELASLRCLDGARCRHEAPSADAIVVHPARPVGRGDTIRIRLRMRGRLRAIDPERTTLLAQGLEGLGAVGGGHGGGDYGQLAHSDGVASMSLFFAQLARMRHGRWEQSDPSHLGDLGSDRLVNVRATIRAPAGARVAATGVETASRTRGDRTERVVHATFVRDFALVASPRLRRLERTVGGVRVRSWFVDGRRTAGRTALETAAHCLSLFERRFGAYPYPELDVVEAPLVGGAGGVELSGMVTVATMFYRPVRAGAGGGPLAGLLGARAGTLERRREAMLEFVTAHEVAHQWWHGIVGSDSRQHPFQDEALAQYSAILYVEDRYGAERARREAEQQVASGYHAMRLMGRPDAPVDRPASAFSGAMTYAGLVYGKGPYLYRELRDLLGDRRFFAALRGYVDDHRFRVAPARALFDRMARGRWTARVRALERRWLDEAHGDDDLGEPDAGRLLGGAGGDAPAVRDLLRGLLGGGSEGGPSDPAVRDLLRGLLEGDAPGGASDEQLQELLRGLMGGADDEALRELLDR